MHQGIILTVNRKKLSNIKNLVFGEDFIFTKVNLQTLQLVLLLCTLAFWGVGVGAYSRLGTNLRLGTKSNEYSTPF